MHTSHRSTLFPARRLLVALLSTMAVAGCSTGGGSGASDTRTRAAAMAPMSDATSSEPAQAPLSTTAADWTPVADALGFTGSLQGGVVYRVPLVRRDLTVTTDGVQIKPGLSLGGYAAFARYSDGSMLMGDLVVTEAELPKVTDALQAAGLEQTALHKHLLTQNPAIWWTHIHGMGDPVKLAQGLKAVLAATGIKPPPAAATPSPSPAPLDLDTAGIDVALGRHGTTDGGVYKFTVARKEQVTAAGHVLPPQLGLTTGIGFQPTGGGKAAINGDFVMTGPESQNVIAALRRGGIGIVEVHNHSMDEQPRLFYVHFWAVGDGVTLAKALRPALDATDPAAP